MAISSKKLKLILLSPIAIIPWSIIVFPLLYGLGTSITVPVESQKASIQYSEIIGSKYILSEDFIVIGIREDLKENTPDYYVLQPKRATPFSNRYVVSRTTLHSGTKVSVIDVLESKWDWIAPGVDYILKVADSEIIDNNLPLKLDINYFEANYLTKVE